MTHLFRLMLASVALVPVSTLAADGIDSGDTAWMLTSCALVLFMTLPGLALFYGGLVRNKNILSLLMQCFAVCCLMSLLWVSVGYSLAFSGDGSYIGDLKHAFLRGIGLESNFDSIPTTVFVMFQMTFAVITPALIVGAFAERMRFSAMLIFSSAWLLLVYVPVTHWVWGGGWLAQMGFRDFAGGAVVHINAGVAALIAAVMIGNRKGFPKKPMPPHNLPMTVTGAAMLWVGWFGFNAGSALTAGHNAGMAMLVTHLGAAGGSLAWMMMEWIRHKKPSMLGIVTGMVAGLGTITPASGFVGPMGAICIGLLAGVVCYAATQYIKRVLEIDDSLDVFPVHGVGGFLGTLLTAVFSAKALGGLGLDEGVSIGDQFITQVIGCVATLVWCGVLTFVLLKLINLVVPLRVSEEEETEGLDLALHGERGYEL